MHVRAVQQASSDRESESALAHDPSAADIQRFHAWRGRSGRDYVVSVFPLASADPPDFVDAVILAVAGDAMGGPRIVAKIDTGAWPVLLLQGGWLREAQNAGATCLHVHLLAKTVAGRLAMMEDLAVDQAEASAPIAAAIQANVASVKPRSTRWSCVART